MTKKELKGTKNQWEARLSKHNGVTGILDDSGFGTTLFTRFAALDNAGGGDIEAQAQQSSENTH
jgi:hypothetical protein